MNIADGDLWGLPEDDFDTFVQRSAKDLLPWSGARVLVTGGSGFLGSWIVGSLLYANDELNLGIETCLLTRSPDQVPVKKRTDVEIIQRDVRDLVNLGPFDLIIHGAASSSARFGIGDGEPNMMASTIIDGTRAVIEAATSARARLLFLSSGAVYGPQWSSVAEDATTAPDSTDPVNAYGEAKRAAEMFCSIATAAGTIEAVIARLFAFVGPRLPLEGHFAAGNFLNDALHQRSITVAGDGSPYRSYLYTGDLPEWCWAIISRGKKQKAYNVGSPVPVSIKDLADRIGGLATPPVPVRILEPIVDGPARWYVPDTTRARNDLELEPRSDLDTALAKSLQWFRSLNS